MTSVGAHSIRHYFVDEAGDGNLFNRRGQVVVGSPGCSRYFILGLLDIPEPARIARDLHDLRTSLLADSVDRNGRIEETRDGGKTWAPAATGLEVPWPRHMVERFVQIGQELFAVLSNGELVAAPLATLGWRRILPDVDRVRAVAAAPQQF